MKTIYHPSNSRGFADHGWLKANHSFSFGNYHNSERTHFGVLRVLNDDYIEGGMGFGTHPHANMEIITIPISGELHHKDSMGNFGEISAGEIQVMSAGKGIEHSEYNGNKNIPIKLLQIWVIPNKINVEPRYDQIKISDNTKPNDFQQIISPNQDDEGSWIHQNAWFNLAKFDKGISKNYQIHQSENGVYAFVISGKAKIAGINLSERDGLGIWETENFEVEAEENTEILLMEIPMKLPKI